jgi:hypothetical protein
MGPAGRRRRAARAALAAALRDPPSERYLGRECPVGALTGAAASGARDTTARGDASAYRGAAVLGPEGTAVDAYFGLRSSPSGPRRLRIKTVVGCFPEATWQRTDVLRRQKESPDLSDARPRRRATPIVDDRRPEVRYCSGAAGGRCGCELSRASSRGGGRPRIWDGKRRAVLGC